jgi:hypothetical protein
VPISGRASDSKATSLGKPAALPSSPIRVPRHVGLSEPTLGERFNQFSNTRNSDRQAPNLCRGFERELRGQLGTAAMLGRLLATMRCLFFLLVTAAPLNALAQDVRPVPPLPIGHGQATASDHARDLSEMADRAANISARCQSSGAALGSQAYKKCRASLEDKMFDLTTPAARRY